VTIRRRRSFSRRTRLKRSGTWVIGASAACGLEVEPIDCNDVATGAGVATFEYVFKLSPFSAGQAGEDNPATVVRMVGDQHVAGRFVVVNGQTGDMGTLHIIEMWYIADIDSTGALTPKDPTNAADLKSGDIMHMRSTLYTVTGPLVRQFSHSTDRQDGGSHIDFRVKRKLKESEEIAYSIVAVTDLVRGSTSVDAIVNVYGNVRAYVLC